MGMLCDEGILYVELVVEGIFALNIYFNIVGVLGGVVLWCLLFLRWFGFFYKLAGFRLCSFRLCSFDFQILVVGFIRYFLLEVHNLFLGQIMVLGCRVHFFYLVLFGLC